MRGDTRRKGDEGTMHLGKGRKTKRNEPRSFWTPLPLRAPSPILPPTAAVCVAPRARGYRIELGCWCWLLYRSYHSCSCSWYQVGLDMKSQRKRNDQNKQAYRWSLTSYRASSRWEIVIIHLLLCLHSLSTVKVPHSASEVLTFLAIERELYHILIRRALMAMLVQADVRWCGIGLFFAIAVNSDGGLDASSSASSFCYSKLSLNSSSVLLFGAVPLLSRCITHIIDLRSQRRGKEVCGKIGHDRSWMRKRSTKFGCFFQSQ